MRFAGDDPGAHRSGPSERARADLAARLCADGLRISATLTPDLHRATVRCAERLGLSALPEVFVVAQNELNACTPCLGLAQRPLVIVTSGLVKLLSNEELVFILGHELGHLGLEHGVVHGARDREYGVDELHDLVVKRASEVSADRIGLIAVRSLFTAAMVMVKTASGLADRHITLDVQSFLDQLRSDADSVHREWELTTGHPSLPLRLRALIRFAESTDYLRLSETGVEGASLREVDVDVQAWMSALGGGRLLASVDDRHSRTLAWIGAALVTMDGASIDVVRSALADDDDEGLFDRALGFASGEGRDALAEKLQRSTRALRTMDPLAYRRVLDQAESVSVTSGLDWSSTFVAGVLVGAEGALE